MSMFSLHLVAIVVTSFIVLSRSAGNPTCTVSRTGSHQALGSNCVIPGTKKFGFLIASSKGVCVCTSMPPSPPPRPIPTKIPGSNMMCITASGAAAIVGSNCLLSAPRTYGTYHKSGTSAACVCQAGRAVSQPGFVQVSHIPGSNDQCSLPSGSMAIVNSNCPLASSSSVSAAGVYVKTASGKCACVRPSSPPPAKPTPTIDGSNMSCKDANGISTIVGSNCYNTETKSYGVNSPDPKNAGRCICAQ